MPEHVCSVCGRPATNAIKTRWFCEDHYQSATHERKHTWRNFILLVLVLLIFVGLVFFLDALIKPVLTGSTLVLAGVLLALVPAAIWMVIFYLQDRIEPEPKGFIFAVFVLGGLLAAALNSPILENMFRTSKWIYTDTVSTILGSILVVGFTQEFLKYAAVRFSVFNSSEFDEPTDGVIYATAAGLGYATILNIQFVTSNGGVDLGTSVIRMAIVALAQASFASITGFFLGRLRFEQKAVWWMPLGLMLAAIANGLFNWLRGRVVQSGISLTSASVNPWMGLVLAALVAVVITGIILWLVRRDIRLTLAEKSEAGISATTRTSQTLAQSVRVSDPLLILLTVVALLVGWYFKASVENRSTPFESTGISAQAPEGWLNVNPQGREILHVTELSSKGFGTTYIVESILIEKDSSFGQAASLLTLERGQTLTAFRVLDQKEITVSGKQAYEISYVFVESNSNLTHNIYPNIVHGLDIIFLNGDHAVVATFWADRLSYDYDLGRFQLFLKSLKF